MIAAAGELLTTVFAAPEAALLFVGVAVVAWLTGSSQRRRARRLDAVVGPRAPALAAERSTARERRRARLAVVGLASCVVACMQPRLGRGEATGTPPAADLCICLDVSRSMLAGDLQPTRLGFAQQAIAELGDRARGDRMALVVFAGEARLRVPLTRDVQSLVEIARGVDPSDVALGGTDLGAAIDAGVRALAAARGATTRDGADAQLDGALLLVTDGEDPTGAGRAAAERARRRGLSVHCVGVGSALGSKITVVGADGRQTFLRDREGNEVLTRLDATSLRALVADGGVYVDAASTAAPLVAAYERGVLPSLTSHGSAASDAEGELAHRFQVPLAIALLALLLELLLPHRRRLPRALRAGGIA